MIPGGTVTVTVVFNCETTTSFSTLVLVTASAVDGSGTDAAQVSVTMAISA